MESGEILELTIKAEALLLAFNPKILILSKTLWGFGSKRMISEDGFSW
jgi:hypothetical protein